MKKLNEQFARLNKLRTDNGKAPLKDWKESNTKLLEAIRKEEADGIKGKSIKAVADASKDETILDRAAGKKKLTKKAKPAANAGEYKSLAEICKALGINPKVARAKLRKKFDDWSKESLTTIHSILSGNK